MKLLCYLLNSALCAAYRREHRTFLRTRDVRAAQEARLAAILRANENTAFGEAHGFSGIADAEAYRRRVPLCGWDDMRPWMERVEQGEPNVLTAERVLLLEPTSGSTTGSKLIPYTRSLRGEMQKGIQPWIYDLYTSVPGLKWGESYWSVSPAATRESYTAGGVPIGFEDDTGYFGALEGALLKLLFAVPGDVAREPTMEQFTLRTCLGLLRCRSLTLVSVWNPTFFLLLLDAMEANLESLLPLLSSRRRDAIERAVREKRYDRLWPNLKVISCWCDANAAPYAGRLRALFPKVLVQPKGIIATECFVSFPLIGQEGALLSVHSHFYEFLSKDGKETFLAHELRDGEEYEVVVTTGGGLYRYRMRDAVRVVGHTGGIPRLVFFGKNDRVSDLFGEKLHESFVSGVLARLGLEDAFALLAPEEDRYILYYAADIPVSACSLDALLRENFHYNYCRELGQLRAPRAVPVAGDAESAYFRHLADRGMRLGDIKPARLVSFGGWGPYLGGSRDMAEEHGAG